LVIYIYITGKRLYRRRCVVLANIYYLNTCVLFFLAITNVEPSKDIDLFYKNMSKVMVTLVASAVPSQNFMYGKASGNMASTLQNGNMASTMSARTNYSTLPNGSLGSMMLHGSLGSTMPSDYLSSNTNIRDQSSTLSLRNPSSNLPPRYPATTTPTSHRTTTLSTGTQISDEPVKHTNR